MPAAEVVGKWKSRSDFQGGTGRRLFHNLSLSPESDCGALPSLAGFQVIMYGRFGVIAEDRHAIDEFVDWYCSEPRRAFNKTVILRYRIHVGSRKLAPGTINLRLGAIRQGSGSPLDQ